MHFFFLRLLFAIQFGVRFPDFIFQVNAVALAQENAAFRVQWVYALEKKLFEEQWFNASLFYFHFDNPLFLDISTLCTT